MYRVKSFTLFLESAILAWDLLWLADRVPVIRPWVWIALGLAELSALALSSAGLGLMALRRVQRFTGVASGWQFLDKHPYGPYLAATQFVFLSGLVGGQGLYQQKPEQFGGALIAIGLSGALIQGLALVVSIFTGVQRSTTESLAWFTFFSGLSVFGYGVGPSALEPSFRGIFWPTAGIGFIIGFAYLEWLVHPFPRRQTLTPTAPRRLRLTLAFLIFTAVVPLGGLAIPVWIYLRHRRWPALQREWLDFKGV